MGDLPTHAGRPLPLRPQRPDRSDGPHRLPGDGVHEQRRDGEVARVLRAGRVARLPQLALQGAFVSLQSRRRRLLLQPGLRLLAPAPRLLEPGQALLAGQRQESAGACGRTRHQLGEPAGHAWRARCIAGSIRALPLTPTWRSPRFPGFVQQVTALAVRAQATGILQGDLRHRRVCGCGVAPL